jgi:hypothetical protein
MDEIIIHKILKRIGKNQTAYEWTEQETQVLKSTDWNELFIDELLKHNILKRISQLRTTYEWINPKA